MLLFFSLASYKSILMLIHLVYHSITRSIQVFAPPWRNPRKLLADVNDVLLLLLFLLLLLTEKSCLLVCRSNQQGVDVSASPSLHRHVNQMVFHKIKKEDLQFVRRP